MGLTVNFKHYLPQTVGVIVHWLPWFGTVGHVPMEYLLANTSQPIPYVSSNIAICDDQCAEMRNRGIDGVNVDYYGPESPSALAALRMLRSCENAGLYFSICLDQGSISPAIVSQGATAIVAEYARQIRFIQDAFMTSPSYMRDGKGRAIVSFFGEPLGLTSANWGQIKSGFTIPVAFLFEGAFTHASGDGAFGWVNPTTPANDINTVAIDAFIRAAAKSPSQIAFYPVYPGFDDSLASWGQNRFMGRRSNQTLIDTLILVPGGAQYVMVSTWNDHEEGTAIETAASVPLK